MVLFKVEVISEGGTTIFLKEFAQMKQQKPGSTFVPPMKKRWRNFVGSPIVYLEFDSLAWAMITNVDYHFHVLLMYSASDGEVFGKLIATHISQAFAEAHGEQEKGRGQALFKQGTYKAFETKLAGAVEGCLSPIVEYLQTRRGISKCVLFSKDQILPANVGIDPISFVSEHKSLAFQMKQLTAFSGDSVSEVMIDAKGDQLLLVRNIENSALLVTFNKVDKKRCLRKIDRYTRLLSSVLKLVASLGTVTTDSLFHFSSVL